MKCDNFKALVDPCIDCELMIILIDLILQKTRAYHHILFNKLSMWDYLLTRTDFQSAIQTSLDVAVIRGLLRISSLSLLLSCDPIA
ncbi:uncharacterized protein LOC120703460 [Panicum virgatum]|uniref:uncharacterized protein LOC120703460 n=1 Tax=Panicum virgatum TaxID=38727 RepID=UPI0019D6A9B5|nr:uncharacterized protein LOC120703460 [Panicum virgatum]